MCELGRTILVKNKKTSTSHLGVHNNDERQLADIIWCLERRQPRQSNLMARAVAIGVPSHKAAVALKSFDLLNSNLVLRVGKRGIRTCRPPVVRARFAWRRWDLAFPQVGERGLEEVAFAPERDDVGAEIGLELLASILQLIVSASLQCVEGFSAGLRLLLNKGLEPREPSSDSLISAHALLMFLLLVVLDARFMLSETVIEAAHAPVEHILQVGVIGFVCSRNLS